MKVLLVTGQLAKESVMRYAKESSLETEIMALKIAVAAFLTPETILKALKAIRTTDYNMILVPGLMRGDAAKISRAVGIPTFKGPRYAADLPVVLDLLCEAQLSTIVAADDVFQEIFKQKALEEIKKVECTRDALLKKPGAMLVGDVAIGKDFPMRVLAEIVDAALMDKTTIQKTAKRFVAAGADIIDVGMVAGESQPEKAKNIVQWVKEVVTVPVSIDTLDAEEIKAAIQAGVEMVLSGDAGNLEEIAPYAKNTVVVLIPTNQRQGHFPKKTADRVKYMEEIVTKAKSLGIKRYLVDLIVEPLAILESFTAYKEFTARNPSVPLFVGISNVTELMDADSVGVNAILARLSSEIGGIIILATEKSSKAKGTVAEEVAAAKMMFLAKKRASVPKDLGVDLLILKDKHTHEEPYNKNLDAQAKVIQATRTLEPPAVDSLGLFRISLDREEGVLVAAHYLKADSTRPINVLKGKTAEDVYNEVLKMGLVSTLHHAAYLGKELAKAEIALFTGKDYIQDDDLFK